MSNAPEKAAQAMTYLQQYVPEEYGKYLQFTGSLGKIGKLASHNPGTDTCKLYGWVPMRYVHYIAY